MSESDNRIVMFVDLLGFASLTEAFPFERRLVSAFERPLSIDNDSITAFHGNGLFRSFSAFHQSLRSEIDFAKMIYPLTVVAFSDSAFVVTSHLFEAAELAERLLRSLLTQRVPARIGIAYGSFHPLRFRSDTVRKESLRLIIMDSEFVGESDCFSK